MHNPVSGKSITGEQNETKDACQKQASYPNHGVLIWRLPDDVELSKTFGKGMVSRRLPFGKSNALFHYNPV